MYFDKCITADSTLRVVNAYQMLIGRRPDGGTTKDRCTPMSSANTSITRLYAVRISAGSDTSISKQSAQSAFQSWLLSGSRVVTSRALSTRYQEWRWLLYHTDVDLEVAMLSELQLVGSQGSNFESGFAPR